VAFVGQKLGNACEKSIIGEAGGDAGFSFEPLWQRCRAEVGLEAVRLRRGAGFQLAHPFSFHSMSHCTVLFRGARIQWILERRIYWLLGLGQVRVEGTYLHGPCWRANGKIQDVSGRSVAGKEGREIVAPVMIGRR
jgi:hypothetical protein